LSAEALVSLRGHLARCATASHNAGYAGYADGPLLITRAPHFPNVCSGDLHALDTGL